MSTTVPTGAVLPALTRDQLYAVLGGYACWAANKIEEDETERIVVFASNQADAARPVGALGLAKGAPDDAAAKLAQRAQDEDSRPVAEYWVEGTRDAVTLLFEADRLSLVRPLSVYHELLALGVPGHVVGYALNERIVDILHARGDAAPADSLARIEASMSLQRELCGTILSPHAVDRAGAAAPMVPDWLLVRARDYAQRRRFGRIVALRPANPALLQVSLVPGDFLGGRDLVTVSADGRATRCAPCTLPPDWPVAAVEDVSSSPSP